MVGGGGGLKIGAESRQISRAWFVLVQPVVQLADQFHGEGRVRRGVGRYESVLETGLGMVRMGSERAQFVQS